VNAVAVYGRSAVEPRAAAALTALLGAGIVLGLAGAQLRAESLAAAGGGLAAAALIMLVAAGWLDGAVTLALAVPLPAIYETATLRIAAAAPITAAVLFAWMLRRAVSDEPFDAGRVPVRALMLLGATLAVAGVAGTHPVVSARELLNLALLVALLLLAADAFRGRPDTARAAMRTLVVAATACGALAVLEMLGVLPGRFPRYETAFNRAALGFGQPNGLGLFFALVVPFAVYEWNEATSRWARARAATALVFIAAGLLATFSRGAWLSVLGGTAVLALTGDARFAARVLLCALLAAVAADVVTGGALRDTAARTIDDWVIEQRAALMLAGILMFLARPWLGVGPGGFEQNLDRYGAQLPQLWDYLPTPHNAYVQMAAESGIVGLAAFLFLLFVILRLLVRRVRESRSEDADARGFRRAVLWSFGVLCCACMVVWPFAHGTGQAVMLILAAGLAADAETG
jgi:O-antigen ligase